MEKDRIISLCSAPAGSYAVVIWPDNCAIVLPVTCYVVCETESGRRYITAAVSDHTNPLDGAGAPELLEIYQDAEWTTFAPGENGLRWAEQWQEATGRKITHWDVSAWWPSQSPLFATADETLWTDDFVPPDLPAH